MRECVSTDCGRWLPLQRFFPLPLSPRWGFMGPITALAGSSPVRDLRLAICLKNKNQRVEDAPIAEHGILKSEFLIIIKPFFSIYKCYLFILPSGLTRYLFLPHIFQLIQLYQLMLKCPKQSIFFYTPPLIFNLAMHTSTVLARAGGKGNWPFNLQENLIIS